MFKYAQIDLTTGICIGISYLSGEVEAENMYLLIEEDNVNLGDTWDGETWTPAPPIEPEPQGPTDKERIAELETQLAQTNADLAAVLEMMLLP